MFQSYLLLPICLCTTTLEGYRYIEPGDICRRITGQLGSCTHFNDCPAAIAELRAGGRPEICSFQGLFPIVCCPVSANLIEAQALQAPSRTGNVPVPIQQRIENDAQENDSRRNTSNSQPSTENTLRLRKCREYYGKWQQNNSLAVEETPSETMRHPHVALLGYVETVGENKKISWKCIGTLVSERFVLTSARCANPQRIGTLKYVQLGRPDINSNNQDAESQDFTVKAIHVHPDFQYFSLYNDIGLVELNSRVQFTKYVKPACVAVTEDLNHVSLETAGYGLMKSGYKLGTNRMNYGFGVNCKQTYDTNLRDGNFSNQLICTEGVAGDDDSCNVDIGGPLQFTNSDYEFAMFPEIAGIYLFGSLCGTSGDIFISTFPYASWIEKIVWPNS